MPFYTYCDINTDPPTVEEYMLPIDHEPPIGKDGQPMVRVFKATHHIIPTNLHHEKSANWQQGRINEKEW